MSAYGRLRKVSQNLGVDIADACFRQIRSGKHLRPGKQIFQIHELSCLLECQTSGPAESPIAWNPLRSTSARVQQALPLRIHPKLRALEVRCVGISYSMVARFVVQYGTMTWWAGTKRYLIPNSPNRTRTDGERSPPPLFLPALVRRMNRAYAIGR
jgi:hypothetical protein